MPPRIKLEHCRPQRHRHHCPRSCFVASRPLSSKVTTWSAVSNFPRTVSPYCLSWPPTANAASRSRCFCMLPLSSALSIQRTDPCVGPGSSWPCVSNAASSNSSMSWSASAFVRRCATMGQTAGPSKSEDGPKYQPRYKTAGPNLCQAW